MTPKSDGPPTRPGSPGGHESSVEAGVARWAQEYSEDLRRFLAKRRIIESEIKDICQEVYLRMLRFERSEVVQNPQAYIFRVAANVAHDFKLRRAQRIDRGESVVAPEITGEPTPEEVAESAYRARCLLRVMAALPPLPRAAVVLQYHESLSYEQIAERLGVSHRTVKRAVARGYALMRAALQEEM